MVASSSHASDANVQIFRMNNGGLSFYVANDPNLDGTVISASSVGIVANEWTHLAVSRSGSNTRMYVDGTQVGATNTSWTGAFTCNVIGQFFFGGTPQSGGAYVGRLSEFRTAESAYYTGSSFTVPTGPFPAP